MKKCVFIVACLLICGCQSVTYRVDVSGDNNSVTIPGNTEIAKPIEISPARSVEADADVKDNTLPVSAIP